MESDANRADAPHAAPSDVVLLDACRRVASVSFGDYDQPRMLFFL